MRCLILLLVFAPAARSQSVEARLGDLRLATAVRLALVRDAATRALDVDVAAQDGAVRLGSASPDALRVAQSVAGVRSVNGSAGGSASPRPSEPRTIAETPRAVPPPEAPASAWGAAPRADPPRAATPTETPRTEAGGPAVHIVGRGETLFSLARRYGMTVEALRRLNGLAGSAGIEIGQRLRLR